MSELTLYLGNRTYSSWSLRAWLVLKQAGADFEEVVIPLQAPGTPTLEIQRYSPSGKVPALQHGVLTIWESLAIAEYAAELFPAAKLWPEARDARAVARSVSAEMASSFAALRTALPMNVRRKIQGVALTDAASQDIARVQAIWNDCRSRFGQGGEFLFGRFSVADAMYAPVATRFDTYGVELDAVSRRYVASILALPAMQAWIAKAREEPHIIEAYEAIGVVGV
ncbi:MULTISPECIES: glutathione S-transferase family protein [Sorangium]|uniref:Probable glutathione S-transferase n=1 Tax=Sorangium cellulosum (strain So ce56) TaxID=448385 RepID=A9GVW6_SORC5|nr:glutathione S-transferase family protein [Sorangium cellulosum]CAN93852.1 probable glutathione S-transferase [Sorangium cellulosum So ce56]